jgi:hypothetical protein
MKSITCTLMFLLALTTVARADYDHVKWTRNGTKLMHRHPSPTPSATPTISPTLTVTPEPSDTPTCTPTPSV